MLNSLNPDVKDGLQQVRMYWKRKLTIKFRGKLLDDELSLEIKAIKNPNLPVSDSERPYFPWAYKLDQSKLSWMEFLSDNI